MLMQNEMVNGKSNVKNKNPLLARPGDFYYSSDLSKHSDLGS